MGVLIVCLFVCLFVCFYGVYFCFVGMPTVEDRTIYDIKKNALDHMAEINK